MQDKAAKSQDAWAMVDLSPSDRLEFLISVAVVDPGTLVYPHWLGPESGPAQGPGPGRIFLIRTLGTFSGPEEWVWYPFFILKMFPLINTSFTICGPGWWQKHPGSVTNPDTKMDGHEKSFAT